ncbi:hypothetical protein TeGR_g9619, partial [Tetraparma gracilis]
VKCDKNLPCSRCIRRNYFCSSQIRGPGRPPSRDKGKVAAERLAAQPVYNAAGELVSGDPALAGLGRRKRAKKEPARNAQPPAATRLSTGTATRPPARHAGVTAEPQLPGGGLPDAPPGYRQPAYAPALYGEPYGAPGYPADPYGGGAPADASAAHASGVLPSGVLPSGVLPPLFQMPPIPGGPRPAQGMGGIPAMAGEERLAMVTNLVRSGDFCREKVNSLLVFFAELAAERSSPVVARLLAEMAGAAGSDVGGLAGVLDQATHAKVTQLVEQRDGPDELQ